MQYPLEFFHKDLPMQHICYIYTVKALLSPPGAYLIFDLLEGGLNREGGLIERGA